jgi:hypothetical protein
MHRQGRIAMAILAAFIAFIPWRGTAQQQMDASARILFDSANRERTSRGIPALKWDSSLAEAAHQHALRMADQNTLSHQLAGEPDLPIRENEAGAKLSAAAENIALGPSVPGLHAGWMNSPPHRHNLLDPQLDSVGIAAVQRQKTFFAVEDFSRALEVLSLAEQEKMVATPIRAAGLTMRLDNNDARRVCEGRQPSDSQPMFMAEFSSTDLNTLPNSLKRAIHSGNYVQAEVGACTKPATDGLSEYHVAVLLY